MFTFTLLIISTVSMLLCLTLPFFILKKLDVNMFSLSQLGIRIYTDLPYSLSLLISAITFILWLTTKLGSIFQEIQYSFVIILISSLAILGVSTFRMDQFYKTHLFFVGVHFILSSFGIIYFGAQIYQTNFFVANISIFLGTISLMITQVFDRFEKNTGLYIPEVLHTIPILLWAWIVQLYL